jgi:DNA-binding MarR family transcriptional regulator/GNAT superfamily N-acetyltransferase
MHPARDGAAALRDFNRFYTRRIGVLGAGLLDTRFSLTEARLLWELAQRPHLSAGELARELELDAGYLSRLIKGLRAQGLVRARRAAADRRRWQLTLTAAGQRALAPLDQRSQQQSEALLARLAEPQRQELLYATQRVRSLLGTEPPAPPQLRPLRAGELGWVVARHGALYALEYGWDWRFEALVARICAEYVERFDARREQAWVAEWQGVPMGCVFLVQARDEAGAPMAGVAQLRLLLVEPAARGQGLGKLLVAACEGFAVGAGYRRMRLWTNSLLLAARGIYQSAGYRLVGSEQHHSFGHALVGEVWEKNLPTP